MAQPARCGTRVGGEGGSGRAGWWAATSDVSKCQTCKVSSVAKSQVRRLCALVPYKSGVCEGGGV